MPKFQDIFGSTAFKKAVRSEDILALHANEARSCRVTGPLGVGRDILDWLTFPGLRLLKWTCSPMANPEERPPTPHCLGHYVYTRDARLHASDDFVPPIRVLATRNQSQALFLSRVVWIYSLYARIYFLVFYASSKYLSNSQFVTASFHTLTSCSLVPPK